MKFKKNKTKKNSVTTKLKAKERKGKNVTLQGQHAAEVRLRSTAQNNY